jgi:hypothetical protein
MHAVIIYKMTALNANCQIPFKGSSTPALAFGLILDNVLNHSKDLTLCARRRPRPPNRMRQSLIKISTAVAGTLNIEQPTQRPFRFCDGLILIDDGRRLRRCSSTHRLKLQLVLGPGQRSRRNDRRPTLRCQPCVSAIMRKPAAQDGGRRR